MFFLQFCGIFRTAKAYLILPVKIFFKKICFLQKQSISQAFNKVSSLMSGWVLNTSFNNFLLTNLDYVCKHMHLVLMQRDIFPFI